MYSNSEGVEYKYHRVKLGDYNEFTNKRNSKGVELNYL